MTSKERDRLQTIVLANIAAGLFVSDSLLFAMSRNLISALSWFQIIIISLIGMAIVSIAGSFFDKGV